MKGFGDNINKPARHCERSEAIQKVQNCKTGLLRRLCLLAVTMAMGAIFTSPANAQDVTTGLVGHWKLDETGGTTAADSTGNGNDGTMQSGLTGADSVEGRAGTALAFDDQFITVPDLLGSESALTVSAWVNAQSWAAGGDYNTFVRQNRDSGAGGTFALNYSAADKAFIFALRNSSDEQDTVYGSFPDDPPLNQWFHLVGVYDGSDVVLYVNGTEVDRQSQSGTLYLSDNVITIGKKWQNGIYPTGDSVYDFDGAIDDVRIYDRPLTAADVQALYKTFNGNLRYNASFNMVEYFDGDDWTGTGPQKYFPNAVEFDGTNDYFSNYSWGENSKQLTGSFWVYLNSSGADRIIFNADGGTNPNSIKINASNELSIDLGNGGVRYLELTSDPLPQDSWVHVLFSFDLSDSNKRHIYLNDNEGLGSVDTYTDNAIDFTFSHKFFARESANNKFEGNISDFWFDTGTYIDLSIESNRRKFINADSNPVYLGADGSAPTGSAPDIFLSGDTDDWHTNKGTGSGFTENGELTTAATVPGQTPDCTISNGSLSLADSIVDGTNLDRVTDIAVQGNYAYVVSWQLSQLMIFDISDPANIISRDTHTDATKMDIVRGVAVQGNYAYVTGYSYDGVTVYDISDPDNIVEHGTITSSQINGAFDIKVRDNYAFVTAAQGNSLVVLDISDPANPAILDRHTDPTAMNNPVDLVISGDYAYVETTAGDSIAILDISDPSDIALRDYHVDATKLNNGGGLAVQGDFLYALGISDSRMTVYDISNPDNIIERGTIGGMTNAGAVTVSGDYAFVAGNSVYAIDITNPDNPTIVDTFTDGTNAYALSNTVLDGQYIFGVSESIDAFAAIDIGCDPAISSCTNPDRIEGSLMYNTTHNVMQFCDGTEWVAMGPVPGSGGGGCSNPSGNAGGVIFNNTYNVLQYCDGANWVAIGKAVDLCAGSPSPGTVCYNGSVYAGLSPDGNVPMFTTPADAPGLLYTWNNGTSNYIDTAMVNCTGTAESSCNTGRSNTTFLMGLSDAASPYASAEYCDGLTAHGEDDWYLPALNELDVLYDNRVAIGGFIDARYWTSSESSNFLARLYHFDSGDMNDNLKSNNNQVRCVRRD